MNKRLIKMYYKKGIYKEKDLKHICKCQIYHRRRQKRNYGGLKNEHMGNN